MDDWGGGSPMTQETTMMILFHGENDGKMMGILRQSHTEDIRIVGDKDKYLSKF